MVYRVFISYSSKDLSKVDRVRNMLRDSSVEVYVAEYAMGAGEQITEAVISQIKRSDLFLLFWSRSAKESEWVPQEIGVAKADSKNIIPLILEPNIELPGFISDLKYLNVYQNPEKSLAWLQDHVFKKAGNQQKAEGLVWLGLGAALLWLARE